jgi:predicted MFS family arabinose efflux permease
MLLVYTIVKPAAEDGWGAGRTLAYGAVAIALLGAFVAREATARTPLMPLRIFRSRNVAGANLIQALTVAGMFGMFFMGALYLQRVLGYDPLQIGLAFLPTTIVMGGLSLVYAEKLITRFGARRTLIPGLGLVAAGLLLFARAPVDGSYVTDVLPVLLLIGTGVALCFPALMTLAMSGATPSDAGLASGLVNTTVQVGGALGLAVLATLAATETGSRRAAGEQVAAALNGGYHLAYLIGAGLVLVAIAIALTVLRPEQRAAQEAEKAAEMIDLHRSEPAYSQAA